MEKIRTRRILTAVLGMLALVLAHSVMKVKAQSRFPHPRFEQVLFEYHPESETRVSAFEVWHDKESGQEFTCTVYRQNSVSCFPTGRSWLNGN